MICSTMLQAWRRPPPYDKGDARHFCFGRHFGATCVQCLRPTPPLRLAPQWKNKVYDQIHKRTTPNRFKSHKNMKHQFFLSWWSFGRVLGSLGGKWSPLAPNVRRKQVFDTSAGGPCEATGGIVHIDSTISYQIPRRIRTSTNYEKMRFGVWGRFYCEFN